MFDTARTPVDKTAANVIKGGVYYTPDKRIANVHSPTPLPTRSMWFTEKRNPEFVNLTGTKFGQMTVIGISADHKKVWVVRCVCGKYETRSSKAIKNPNNQDDCCQWCRHLKYLQRKDAYKNECILTGLKR